MYITIGTDEIRKKMGEILDCVRLKGDEFIIERKHHAVAALIPIAKLEALEKAARNFLLDGLSRPDAEITDATLEEILEEAKSKSRKKKKRRR